MSANAQWITIDSKLSFRDNNRGDEFNFNSLPLPARRLIEDMFATAYETGGIHQRHLPHAENEFAVVYWYPPRLGWFLFQRTEDGSRAYFASGYIIVPDNDYESMRVVS